MGAKGSKALEGVSYQNILDGGMHPIDFQELDCEAIDRARKYFLDTDAKKKVVDKHKGEGGRLVYPFKTIDIHGFVNILRDEFHVMTSESELRHVYAKEPWFKKCVNDNQFTIQSLPLALRRFRILHCVVRFFNDFKKLDKPDTGKGFYSFLHSMQHELDVPRNEAMTIMQRFGDPLYSNISYFKLYHYLTNQNLNTAYIVECIQKEYQDMTQPLPYYWIATASFNSLCDCEADEAPKKLTKCLLMSVKRGARAFPLDVWDGDNGEPEVFLKYFNSPSMKFKNAIGMLAHTTPFDKNDLPLFILLDNHCTPQQQAKVAAIYRDIFGQRVITGLLPLQENKSLPSPFQLKGKVILVSSLVTSSKNKRFVDPKQWSSDEDISENNLIPVHNDLAQVINIDVNQKNRVVDLFRPGNVAEAGHNDDDRHKIIRHAILENQGEPNAASFFSEKFLTETAGKDIKFYTRTRLAYVYPTGDKEKSTGMGFTGENPLAFFHSGIQFFPIDYTSESKSTWIADSIFKENEKVGYVLKFPGMRGDGKYVMNYGDKGSGHKVQHEQRDVHQYEHLKIRILAGVNLRVDHSIDAEPQCTIDFQLSTGDLEGITQHQTTGEGLYNGYATNFNIRTEYVLDLPKHGLCCFLLHAKDKERDLGQAAIPVHMLREGVRTVQLADGTGQKMLDDFGRPSSILVHFMFVHRVKYNQHISPY